MVWNTFTGESSLAYKGKKKGIIYTFSLDENKMAVSEDYEITMMDVTTGSINTVLKSPERGMYLIAFSSDRKLLAAGNYNGTVALWNLTNGVFLGYQEESGKAI